VISRLLNSLVSKFRKPLLIGSAQANQLVLDQLAEQGDDGTQDRHVRHTTFPLRGVEGVAGRDRIVDLFARIGLDVSETQYRDGILGEHDAAVATEDFNELTDGLRIELAGMGWEYEGWECAVLKEKGN